MRQPMIITFPASKPIRVFQPGTDGIAAVISGYDFFLIWCLKEYVCQSFLWLFTAVRCLQKMWPMHEHSRNYNAAIRKFLLLCFWCAVRKIATKFRTLWTLDSADHSLSPLVACQRFLFSCAALERITVADIPIDSPGKIVNDRSLYSQNGR